MNKPDFIGIGAQKAATTWIYDVLQDHPEVGLSVRKELDFFSRCFDRGYQWYEKQFASAPGKRVYGEVSPSYLNEPAVPGRVADYSPAMKIVVSLREPVSRVISNHKHEVRVGHLTGNDLSLDSGLRNNPSYVDQGRYATHLRHWLAHFRREQILVLLYEDIVKDPESVARQIYEFLGVSPDFVSSALNNRSNVGHLKRHPRLDDFRRRLRLALAGAGVGWIWESAARLGLRKIYRSTGWLQADERIPPVSDTTRAWLHEEFLPEIEALEDLIGYPLTEWKKGINRPESVKKKITSA